MTSANQGNSITLAVTGMTCSSCVRHVDHALRAVDGVSDVKVDLATGKVKVERDPALATNEALAEAVREAGYDLG